MAISSKRDAFYWIVWAGKKQVWTLTPATTKSQAKQIERECLVALKSTNYSSLSDEARETLIRYYHKAKLEMPIGLRLDVEQTEERDFVLWDEPKEGENRPSRGAIQLFASHPIIRQKKQSTRDRYDMCIYHLVKFFGKTCKMGELWTDDISGYYAARIKQGAAPNTIGHEVSTLSAIFRVLIDCKRKTGISANPCDYVRGNDALSLSFASRKRSAYLSCDLVNTITTVWGLNTKRPLCPEWFTPMLWTSYYTGMRLGEILGVRRSQIHFDKRMIYLTPVDMEIKEGQAKRVPIHRDLAPILKQALRVRAFGSDNVFLLSDRRGTRPPTKDTVELVMKRIVKLLKPEPRISFHFLRHTFRANCSRSGISDRIAERILGHSDKQLSVNERYGEISDEELIAAIDHLTVNNGHSMVDGKPVCLFGNTPNKNFEDCQRDGIRNTEQENQVAVGSLSNIF